MPDERNKIDRDLGRAAAGIVHKGKQQSTGLTCRWDIPFKRDGGILGWVRWYKSRQQYAFFPSEGTVYDDGCLESIRAFLAETNAKHEQRINSNG